MSIAIRIFVAKMISQKSVQEIIETAKIEDIVGEFVNLKRRGVNMLGLCPFHNEKTPSFTVSPAKNIFKCFGCGRGGNPVQFLMEHESFTFPESLRYIAKKYNLDIEETVTSQESIEERQLLDSLYLINQFAKEFFQDQLFNTDIGKSVGLNYFKERGFREETIRKFGLGFAPDQKDKLTLSAVQAGYNIEFLRKLGLTSKFDRDFFRNRVQFTIHNLTGKVIGFGGRILVKNVKAPKYINSPETEIYNKSKVLYGAFFAKKAIRQEDECILVEGYTDVVSLHQNNVENVVSSSGTSLTVGQIRLIKRYTPNIKILYDGDPAGIKAALRGMDLVLEQDMNVKIVMLPEGEDPDSYVQKVGTTAFKEYITNEAKDVILFQTELLTKESQNDPLSIANVIKQSVKTIAKINDPIKRDKYIKECASILKVSESALIHEHKKIKRADIYNKENKEAAEKRRAERNNEPVPIQQPTDTTEGGRTRDLSPTLTNEFKEKDIIRILISSGGEIFDEENNITVAGYILGNIEEVLDDFDNKEYEAIAKECLKLLIDKKENTQQYFLNHPDPTISKLAIDLLHSEFEYSPNWEGIHGIPLNTQPPPEKNFTNDSIQSLHRFKLNKIIKMCDQNQARLKELNDSGDMDQMMKLLKMQKRLLEIRNELAKTLNTVILK